VRLLPLSDQQKAMFANLANSNKFAIKDLRDHPFHDDAPATTIENKLNRIWSGARLTQESDKILKELHPDSANDEIFIRILNDKQFTAYPERLQNLIAKKLEGISDKEHIDILEEDIKEENRKFGTKHKFTQDLLQRLPPDQRKLIESKLTVMV